MSSPDFGASSLVNVKVVRLGIASLCLGKASASCKSLCAPECVETPRIHTFLEYVQTGKQTALLQSPHADSCLRIHGPNSLIPTLGEIHAFAISFSLLSIADCVKTAPH